MSTPRLSSSVKRKAPPLQKKENKGFLPLRFFCTASLNLQKSFYSPDHVTYYIEFANPQSANPPSPQKKRWFSPTLFQFLFQETCGLIFIMQRIEYFEFGIVFVHGFQVLSPGPVAFVGIEVSQEINSFVDDGFFNG